MKISIIIPSYNQKDYIEETLCSILEQAYPHLELIVVDGKSTDGTLEVIKRYEKYISTFISEPDRGQTHAINKGLKLFTGEIWSYLNSDDLISSGSLRRIAECFENSSVNWVGGISDMFDENKHLGLIKPELPSNLKEYLTPWNRTSKYVFPCSNVCFMRRRIFDSCGYFDESYDYSMDIEYYVRAIFKGEFKQFLIPEVIGKWRWHSNSKTLKKGIAYGFREDEVRIAETYLKYLNCAEKDSLISEVEEQKRWLVTRRAMFHRNQSQNGQAWFELLNNLQQNPELLTFRPWYGAIKALIYDAVFAK